MLNWIPEKSLSPPWRPRIDDRMSVEATVRNLPDAPNPAFPRPDRPFAHLRASGLGGTWLAGAFAQLEEIDDEAVEEGYPPVGESAKSKARRLLLALGGSVPWEPAIYPSMDGEIGIYFRSPQGTAALLILIKEPGGAGCYWSTDAENSHKRYGNSSVLPDEFLRGKLRLLSGAALAQASAWFFRQTVE